MLFQIGNFRIVISLFVKARLGAQPFRYEKIGFHSHANKTNFI